MAYVEECVLQKFHKYASHTELDMFSYSFVELIGRGYCVLKLTQTEGVSFLLFHAMPPAGCNTQTVIHWCCDTIFR